MEFVLDPHDKTPAVTANPEFWALAVRVYCPEHVAAAERAVRDLRP